jgi:hypothetical protein
MVIEKTVSKAINIPNILEQTALNKWDSVPTKDAVMFNEQGSDNLKKNECKVIIVIVMKG